MSHPSDWYDDSVYAALDVSEPAAARMTYDDWVERQKAWLRDACVVVELVANWPGRLAGSGVGARVKAWDKQMANRVLGSLSNLLMSWEGGKQLWKGDFGEANDVQRRTAASVSWEAYVGELTERAKLEQTLGVTFCIDKGLASEAWRVLNRQSRAVERLQNLLENILKEQEELV